MKRTLLFIMVMLLTTTYSYSQDTIKFITSECLGNARSTSYCPEGINFKYDNDTLNIYGTIEAGCCGEHFVIVKKMADTIFVAGIDTGLQCDCICKFCFNIKIKASTNDTIVRMNGRVYNTRNPLGSTVIADTIKHTIGICLNHDSKSDTSNCPKGIHFKHDGDSLNIYGTIEANCCGEHLAIIKNYNDSISISTIDTGEVCKCMCEYCFDIKIKASVMDTIVNINGIEYNTKTLSPIIYPIDTIKHIVSGCLNLSIEPYANYFPQEFNYKYQNDSLNIYGFIEANCCGNHHVKIERINDTITVTSFDSDTAMCNCFCSYLFDIKVKASPNDTIIKFDGVIYNTKISSPAHDIHFSDSKSVGNFLAGKWDWTGSCGGMSGYDCQYPDNIDITKSYVFNKMEGSDDSIAYILYRNDSIVSSGKSLISKSKSITGEEWMIDSMPGFVLNNLIIFFNTIDTITFADNCADCYSHGFSRDRGYTTSIFTTTNSDISTFPNPCKNTLYLNNKEQRGYDKASIYDLNGKLVKELKRIGDKISTQDLPIGMYLLELSKDNKVFKTKFTKE